MPDRGYELIYAEAVRGLTQQQQSLDGIRSRAGSLIAATAIATSFLGGVALDGGRPISTLSALAIGAFLLVIVLTLIILSPFWTWTFELSPQTLIATLEGDNPPDEKELLRDTALWMEQYYDANQTQLDRLFSLFLWGAGFLLFEIGAWLFVLGR